jgi:outer membrane protein assembly factor BamB
MRAKLGQGEILIRALFRIGLRRRTRRVAAAIAAAAAAAAIVLDAPDGTSAASPVPASCAPAQVDSSALLDGAVTVSPMPGSADASPQTQISFLGVPAGDLGALNVIGSRSGRHAGRLEAYSEGDGASFLPARPFAAGERVSVSARLGVGALSRPLSFTFTVARPDPIARTPQRLHAMPAHALASFQSRPSLSPPLLTVRHSSPTQASGEILLAPYGVPAQAGPMIVDPQGRLVWFDPLPPGLAATNLQVQTLHGSPVLTWWQGLIVRHGFGEGVDVVDDTRYRTIAEVHAGNGRKADLHDFQITPQGTALLTAYTGVDCDLRSVGGPATSAVTDSLLQEIDIRTGLVMFEWTSLDHVPLTASYSNPAGSSIAWPLDFFHLNSINLDADGTLLLSARNTWALYDVDPRSGQLLWTLGGKDSSYREAAGAASAYQHDARPDGAGAYTIFDNGASPQIHAQSRGVVLSVNSQTRTVSVLTQFLHPGHPLLSDSQGDLQALPGGDWFVGWGQEPDLSEFSADGALLFDASLPSGYESYRALTFPWAATPLRAPALALAPGPHGESAYVSWNGATGVARWELLEGTSSRGLEGVGSVAWSGFETAIPLVGHPPVVQARALDAMGRVIGTSAAVRASASS